MRAPPRVAPLGDRGRRRLWRGLALFWLLVLLAAGGTAATLAWMGAPVETAPRVLIPPPTIQPEAAAPAAEAPRAAAPERTAPTPPPAAEAATPPPAVTPLQLAPATAPAPAAPTQASPAEAPATVSPAPAPPATAALPDAPEPPPLPNEQQSAASHAIPDPDPALLEDGPAGPLPRVAADGRQPRLAYARPFDRADTRPRIGLVMREAPEAALRRLPPTVALAYAAPPPPVLAQARSRGMETLVALPAGLEAARLDTVLGRFAGYVGALGAVPAAPGEHPADAVQDSLRTRGLLYLDPVPGHGAPVQAWGRDADLAMEDAPTRGEIDRQLALLEQKARDTGSALGILPPAPSALWLDRVAGWAATLPERGLVLAPVTAMIRRPASAQR